MKKFNLTRFRLFAFMFGAILSVTVFSQTAFAFTHLNAQMQIGSQGNDVTNLQTYLASDANLYPSGLITGYYGSLTAAAVSRFQASQGLPQVGNIGPLTLAALNSIIDSGSGSSAAGAPIIMNVSASISTSTMTSSSSTPIVTGTATFSWMTNTASQGRVFYSNSPLSISEQSSNTVLPAISGIAYADTAYTTSKSIAIPGLSSGTTYYYMIESVDSAGNVSVTWPNTFLVQ